jgi:hypothetical protein
MFRDSHLAFLQTVHELYSCARPFHDSAVLARLAKAVLPFVTVIPGEPPELAREDTSVLSRKGKKRVRAYEGDELFKFGRDRICRSLADGSSILMAVQGIDHLTHLRRTTYI